jgi:hypothetical protein
VLIDSLAVSTRDIRKSEMPILRTKASRRSVNSNDSCVNISHCYEFSLGKSAGVKCLGSV